MVTECRQGERKGRPRFVLCGKGALQEEILLCGCAGRDGTSGVRRRAESFERVQEGTVLWGIQGGRAQGHAGKPHGLGCPCPPVSMEGLSGDGDALLVLRTADSTALLQGQHQGLCSGVQLLDAVGHTHGSARHSAAANAAHPELWALTVPKLAAAPAPSSPGPQGAAVLLLPSEHPAESRGGQQCLCRGGSAPSSPQDAGSLTSSLLLELLEGL